MIVSKVICKHILDGGSVGISVDNDKLECRSYHIYYVIDELPYFNSGHTMYICDNHKFIVSVLGNVNSV